MNLEGTKNRLRSEVRAPDFDLLWRWLEEGFYVAELLSGELDWESFQEHAEQYAAYQRQTIESSTGRLSPPGRGERADIRVEPTDYEKRAAVVLSTYLAKQAARESAVRKFRDRVLGSRLLSLEEAEEFIWREYEEGLLKDELPPEFIEERMDNLRSSQDHAPLDIGDAASLRQLPIGSAAGYISPEPGNLGVLADWLTRIYPWELEGAARFVLTGEAPDIQPLKVTFDHRHGICTITVQPWVSEKTWRRAYRAVQGDRDNRPLRGKTLAILNYVTEQTNAAGNRPGWEELGQHWNECYPEWAFKTYSGLRKAYLSAVEKLAPSHNRR